MPSNWLNIDRLSAEPAASVQIAVRDGAPRLIVNGTVTLPLAAWSWGLEASAFYFRRSGIKILHPIIGLNAAWTAPDSVNFDAVGHHFDTLLARHPDAFFLPRVHLDVPEWWKDAHPDEMVIPAIEPDPKNPRQYRDVVINPEGGMAWGIPLRDVSLASDVWRDEIAKVLDAFLAFVGNSPLTSRVIGYQVAAGIYGEWHFPMSEFLPDMGKAAAAKLGPAPSTEERLKASYGLLRDPVEQASTIDYYRRFHQLVTDRILEFAAQIKEKTGRRIIVGTFQTYLLENVWIQEGGHLAPEAILASPDIDFIASPYSYQTTNIDGQAWFEHDVQDDSGNVMGRTRGIGGDGGYRVLLESIRRAGKMYFVEIDCSTYLEPHPDDAPDGDIIRELSLLGGVGSTTLQGTRDILRRDLGRMMVSGSGGWLFDFGPTLATGKSWYADEPIINVVRDMVELGDRLATMDLSSVSEIAAVYDYRSFFYTRHWLADAPFRRGSVNMDFFSNWFLSTQVRALHRIGAPIDYLHFADFTEEDFARYRLILMPNLVYLSDAELSRLKSALRNSGATVIWLYAPGIVSDSGVDPSRVGQVTGMQTDSQIQGGSMLIDAAIGDNLRFGIDQNESPRIVVTDPDVERLGTWSDTGQVAFARSRKDGWTSVLSGSGPLPVSILRALARDAGCRIWSTSPDLVVASKEAVMIVATSEGTRDISLPEELRSVESDAVGSKFKLDMHEGEVRFWTA